MAHAFNYNLVAGIAHNMIDLVEFTQGPPGLIDRPPPVEPVAFYHDGPHPAMTKTQATAAKPFGSANTHQ